MNKFHPGSPRCLMLAAALVAASPSMVAAQSASDGAANARLSPEARAVIERMTATLQGLQSYSIRSQISRDQVASYGYKLQLNEDLTMTVQKPDKLRAEVQGDLRNRSFVYNAGQLAMYSPDDAAHVQVKAPETLRELVGGLLNAGVDLPLIDVLYQGTGGTLTEGVRSGIRVGDATIGGVACDHLAFRQASVDWQIWVQKGEQALPRKVLITTRFEVGDPQWQAVLDWNVQPAIDATTFKFTPPAGSTEITFADPAALGGSTP